MKSIIKNGISLSIIRIVTLFFPIIIIPLLISRLGLESYGKVAFMTAIFSYAVIFVSFGFEESATRQIASGFIDKVSKRTFLVNVLLLKLIFSGLIYLILIFSVMMFDLDYLYILFSLVIFVESINPLWYFQGIEKIHYVAFSTGISKLTYLLLTFSFVQSADDLYLVPVLIVISGIISNIYPMLIMWKSNKLSLTYVSNRALVQTIRDAFPIFLANFIPTLKDKIGTIIIGLTFPMAVVAIFDVIMKFLLVLFIPVNIINSAFFPHLSKTKEKVYFTRLMVLVTIYSLFVVLSTFSLTDFVLENYFIAYIEYSSSIKVVSSSVVFYAASVAIAKNVFIIFGDYKYILKSIIYSTTFYLLGIVVLYFAKNISVYSLCLLTTMTFLFEMLIRIKDFLRTNAIRKFA